MREHDLPASDCILRQAFDRFTGIENLFGDKDYVRTRWRAAPELAIAAEADEQLIGSNFVTHWGSLSFFGPLSVEPSLWDRGIGKGLLEATMDLLAAARPQHAALFTFAHSPKHQSLYQAFGFWPQYLTPILQWPVSEVSRSTSSFARFSALNEGERAEALRDCRAVAEHVLDGLDLTREILAVQHQTLGDTVLLHGERLDGFAVCHAGPGTEAGSGLCFVKFAALRPGLGDAHFDRLIDACNAIALSSGATLVEAGVNMACHEAYRRLLARGARAGLIGVAMNRPNSPAYNRPGAYVLGDWR
jgi:predicted N-acetyltransferase YhbS